MWLCLVTLVACDVTITVNNNGNDSVICCSGKETCPCSSLSSALHNMSDNTLINITSESVTLHDIVGMGSGNLSNITIIGNGATIMCNNTGGVYCESCSDVTIMGITWHQCGGKDSEHPITQIPVLAFTNISSELTIQECTFQYSSGCPVYIQLNGAKGNVLIKESNFVANVFDFDYSSHDDLCAGLYISSNAQVVFTINNSRFDGNGCTRNESDNFCPYFGAIVHSNNDAFEHDQYLFENTNFSNNFHGLNVENAVTKLLNVNVYNNINYGIYVYMNAGTFSILSATFINNRNALSIDGDTVKILSSATFISNVDALSITAGTISISSVTFINNANALSINSEESASISIDIDNSTFSNIPIGTSQMGIDIKAFANLTFNCSNSEFNNNQNGAVSIITFNTTEPITTSIIAFTNVTIYNTTGNTFTHSSVYIENRNSIFSIMFTKVNFTSNHYITDDRGMLLINNHFTDWYSTDPVSIQLTDCTFDNNNALDHVVALNVYIHEKQNPYFVVIYDFNVTITLSDSYFDDNVGGKSIVHINVPTIKGWYLSTILVLLDNSTFSNSKGTALYLIIPEFQFEGNTVFINNSATNGAAVYLDEVHVVSIDNTNIKFINNSAEKEGGAMYINLNSDHCNVFQSILNTYNVSFINNSADIAGNSIYFSVPQDCEVYTNISNESSLLYFPNKFKYSQSMFSKNSPVVTSPHSIYLYPPAAIIINNSSNTYKLQQSKMLGEPIRFTASVLDYFNSVTEPLAFSIDCESCGDYVLSTYEQVIIHDHTLQELEVFPRGHSDVVSNTNISITMSSVQSPLIHLSLLVELSSCHTGYLFDKYKSPPQCVCYQYSDIVHCTEQYSEIKIGYWIGFLTEQHYTSSICPRNYCNFAKRTETSQRYYNLPSKSDDQCSSHRTGVACGECKPGYTLAYDSPDCINTDKCSAGMTILVIVLTILYWIAIVAVVFGLMYFRLKIPLGYVYAIIYYYSIVDVLLINDVSEETSLLVSILSSVAKLTPQLFGQLCLVKGLSGIDQQFIHYSHALAVSLILLIIILAAKRSGRLTRFIGPCIIRVICLLLLLSYTSLASTSLQLLRPLAFNDVDEMRTYSSPDIKYFTGRHLAYAIVAILCEVIIVIGLPVFLLLEPLLSHLNQRINFVKIKPLLDEFQFSYKGKYRWFAAYYLICRQVIFLIVYVGNGDYYKMLYYLQTACIIIAMIHICFQPYKNNLLNALDGVILLILVLVVNLNTFSFSFLSSASSIVLVLLPLLLLACFIIMNKLFSHYCKRKKRMHLLNPVEAYGEDEDDNYNNQRR